MKIGCVKEIKTHEYRVGLTPADVRAFLAQGHAVAIEAGAGIGSGFPDADYLAAGATLKEGPGPVFLECDMIIKVKEPQASEIALLREGQILYTYLHLAANQELTQALMERRVDTIAYETMALDNGALPCLRPMSEIAGRLAVQEGAKYLEKPFGGRGVLLGGVPGVPRGKVVILGAGIVGSNATRIAVGMGASVAVLDLDVNRLAALDDQYQGRIQTLYSTPDAVLGELREADLVIGAVLVPGARAPQLVKHEHLRLMKPGAVLVDVAVDQGGCFETTHPTTHEHPVYTIDGVVHYCVANMPGAVPATSTLALTGATVPHGLEIARMGIVEAVRTRPIIARGLNTYAGQCTCPAVAKAFGMVAAPLPF
jgi:alanine dehydrogenase